MDEEFVENVKAYIKSIERYDDIKPIRRKLVDPDESLVGVVVFHDASVSTVSAIVYLLVENKTGGKELRIAKAGTKNHNGSVPVLEHVSRTYSLVIIKPLLAVIHQCGGSGVQWYFFGDSTCSLKLLKEEVNTTNKLSANTKIQLEQMTLLSEMFQEAEVKAVWLPSRLNVSDILTRASKDPIEVANSAYYREAVLPSGERLVDLIGKLEESNTYVRASKGKLSFTPKDDRDLDDLGHFDKSRRKIQERKKLENEMVIGTVIGAIIELKCPRGCKLAECHDAREDYEAMNGDMEDVEQNIYHEDLLDRHFSIIGAMKKSESKSMNTDEVDKAKEVKALRREMKLVKILKRIVNNLNLKRINIPMYGWYRPLVKEQMVKKEYYERIWKMKVLISTK